MRRTRLVLRRRPRATSTSNGSLRSQRRPARTQSIPATASWPRIQSLPRRAYGKGSTFVGPSPRSMRLLGDKIEARKLMRQAEVRVPVVPGTEEIRELEQARLAAAGDRLSGPHQGGRGWRRPGYSHRPQRAGARLSAQSSRPPSRWRPSATPPCTSRSCSLPSDM